MTRRGPQRGRVVGVWPLLTAWFLVTTALVVGAFAVDNGWLRAEPDLRALRALVPSARVTGVEAWHVIGTSRGCSTQVGEYLVARRAAPAVTETILVVGDDQRLIRAFEAASFRVRGVSVRDLAELGIPSEPWLVVRGPDGLTYSGPYTVKSASERRLVASLVGIRGPSRP